MEASERAPQSVAAARGADEPTAEGAVAFIRYYTQVYSAAYESGNTATLQTLSVPACRFCQNSIKDIEDAAEGPLEHRGDRQRRHQHGA